MASESLEKRTTLWEDLVSLWPSLPFLGLGLINAWMALAYGGGVWLSDIEVNGLYMARLYILSVCAGAVGLIAAAFLARTQAASVLCSNRAMLMGAALTALASLLIILVGPFYLGVYMQMEPLFDCCCVLAGVGLVPSILRCGQLYGMLPPRRTLIYAALSQVVSSVVYFIVVGLPDWAPIVHGPHIAGILALVFLPLMAAGLLCIDPDKASGVINLHPVRSLSLRDLPMPFTGFVVFVFVMSFAISMMRADVVTNHAIDNTLRGDNLLMLLRIVMALAFIVYAVRSKARAHAIGKLCSLVAVVSATATACAAAFDGANGTLSLVVYFCVHVFDFMVWCLLAFISVQKGVSALVVFGIGRGVFMLGCAAGWFVGATALPLLPSGPITTTFFLVTAGAMLLLTFGLFSEHDYERLFSPVAENELSLEDLFDIEQRESELDTDHSREKRGRFSRAVEGLAATFSLSGREAEVLRCLAMGYGSERIADTMGVKVNTVRTHTHNVYVKLDVHSREELMRLVDEEIASIS